MEHVVIIGSGCAGLTAALYTARAGLSPLLIDGDLPGGLLTTTTTVENFPGFPEGVDGYQLTANIREQAAKFGARYQSERIDSVDFSGEVKKLTTAGGETIETESVIIATGSSPRMLGIPGEKEFYTKGVHTCATCDGAFYRGKVIMVIGGGDSACEEAEFLTRFGSKVYLAHRRDELRASKIMAERTKANPKIEILWNTVPVEVKGEAKVSSVVVRDTVSGQTREMAVDGFFLAIGHRPQTDFVKNALPMTDEGFLISEAPSMVRTKVAGVYVAGDCADKVYRQAITAAGMGAMAAIEAERWLGVVN
jgi:thioredoxin reductase (NADPH)